MKRTLLTAWILAIALQGSISAQQSAAPSSVSDQDLNLLRKDLRSDQKQIIAANMLLSDVEAQKFWPLYDQYTAEKVKINDVKLTVIKDYAANFEKLTDNQAEALVNKWAEADQSALELRTKYIPLFERVLPGKKAARFFPAGSPDQLASRFAVIVSDSFSRALTDVQPPRDYFLGGNRSRSLMTALSTCSRDFFLFSMSSFSLTLPVQITLLDTRSTNVRTRGPSGTYGAMRPEGPLAPVHMVASIEGGWAP